MVVGKLTRATHLEISEGDGPSGWLIAQLSNYSETVALASVRWLQPISQSHSWHSPWQADLLWPFVLQAY